jgi:hypothetical protein
MTQDAAAQEPPRFLIEAIRVAGTQRAAAGRIVTDESLLKPGQTYSEQELRLAVYRVKRLPFVVDAEFSLEKGSARGAYELVITVEEAKPLFFLADAGARRSRVSSFDGTRFVTDWQEGGSVGGRYFVGNHGLVFGSVQKTEGQDGKVLQAGYTQYNLFGSGGFASLGLFSTVDVSHQRDLQASLTVGIPLTAVQSLRGFVSRFQARSTRRFPLSLDGSVNLTETRSDSWNAELFWTFDTTDDPLFPSSGRAVTGGTSYTKGEQNYRIAPPIEGVDLRQSSWVSLVYLRGRQHWPVTPRQSLSLDLDVTRSRYGSDDGYGANDLRSVVALGYAVDLLGFGADGHRGDLRFETEVAGVYDDFSSPSFNDGPVKSAFVSASLAYRSSWGVARLGFFYDDLWSSL